MSAVHLIVGNFNVNVWTQLGQDFKFQASRHHYLNLAVVPSMKILSFIQLVRDREKVYAINCNMNKCHWHSPMRKQLRKALERWKAICQPFPSTTWMHQKYICEQDIFVSKIYLWTKYIYEKNISMSKIYLWAIYIYNININHDFYSHNIPGICMTNSLLYMGDWSVKHGCRSSSVLCWHGGSTKIPNCQNFFIPHFLEIIPLKLNHTM